MSSPVSDVAAAGSEFEAAWTGPLATSVAFIGHLVGLVQAGEELDPDEVDAAIMETQEAFLEVLGNFERLAVALMLQAIPDSEPHEAVWTVES